jgi:hypothetical protein
MDSDIGVHYRRDVRVMDTNRNRSIGYIKVRVSNKGVVTRYGGN